MGYYKSMMAGIDPLMTGVVFEGDDGGAGGGGDGGDGGSGSGDDGGSGGDGGDAGDGGDGGSGGDGGDGGDTGWRDSITDEDHRSVADRFNSPADAIKSIVDLRKQISTSIRLPGENASDEDVAKFNKAIGVPDSPEGYEFTMPEGREPTDADKAFQGKMAEIFHKSGVSATAAKNLIDGYNEMTVAAEEAQATADKQFVEETEAALQTKWGKDFERNKNLSSRAAKYLFGDNFEDAAQIETKDGKFILDHPVIMEALAKAGVEMAEDGFMKMDPEAAGSVQEEINNLNKELHEAHMAGDSKKAGELNDKVQKLYAKLHGTKPAVGQDGVTA